MSPTGKGWLRIAIEDFLDTFGFGKKIAAWLHLGVENVERGIIAEYPAVFELLNSVPEVRKLLGLDKLMREPGKHEGALAGLTGLAGGLGQSASTALFAPYLKLLNYNIEHTVHTARIDPATAIAANWRYPEQAAMLSKDVGELGWSTDRITLLTKMMHTRAPENILLLNMLRGNTSRDDVVAELRKRGYLDEDIKFIFEQVKLIPNPQDLVRMAVREAWNEEVVTQFKYDADFPPEFAEWMTKQGYSADWAKRFWRAHWELPGVSQSFEMVHRLRPGISKTPFTIDDMRMLLKTADIPAYFRDRLIAISYSPYTRVDVRRLYGQDILTEDQVYQNYLDLGYDVAHAKALTEFTVKGAKAEEKGLTREAVTSLYYDGLISRAKAKGMLQELGYTDEACEFWLLLVDYKLDANEDKAKLSVIHDRYIAGDLDDSQVMAPLGALDLPNDRQAKMLTQWAIERTAKIKKPSAAQLEALYKLGLVRGDDYLAGLLRYGYNAEDAELFITQTDLEIQAAAVKEQERAQAASDKAAASTKATELTKKLAALDAQIAEYRLEIANINVALHNKAAEVSAKILQGSKDQATTAIAQAVLDKALLRAA